ncbi:Anoctamin, partial [Gryllus bimaculatus]
MSTDNPPLKFLPEEEKEGAHDSSYEDETGGLEGLRQPPEDRDTLPNTETLLFRDGRRRIDMVLVYEEEDFGVMTEMEMLRRERRKMFLENLEAEGLELELEDKSMSYDGKTFFVKVHVPWKALTRYAEVMNLKLPTKVGVRRLLNDRTFLGAFPLHEGRYDADSNSGYVFDRRLLYLEWGQLSCWYKKQPLWLVKKYFGDKIGLYFAWLGFYTKMLIPAAIVGVLCFFYGLCTIDTDANMP